MTKRDKSDMASHVDKAGRAYWDKVWDGRPVPDAYDPQDHRLNNHMFQRFHQFFCTAFDDDSASNDDTHGRALIEVGCGQSKWLPYFAKTFGFALAGLDYSEAGCRQATSVLEKAGIRGDIRQVDLFDPPSVFRDRFDIVFSFGLVEHFIPTTDVVRQLAVLARPGGQLVTVAPNMTRAVGWLQKLVDREVYDVHVPLDVKRLAEAHAECGLSVVRAEYLGIVNWSVVNFDGRSDR